MTEEFLLYLWKFRNFEMKDLRTTAGDPLEIIQPGYRNTDSGPDFFNARVRIGETLWAGNIEFHVHASDWERHNHQADKAYDNIVLHVVYEADHKVCNAAGTLFPTLELKDRVPAGLYEKYKEFKNNFDWIPCGKQIRDVRVPVMEAWLERMLAERLEEKTNRIQETLSLYKNDWEETFYIHLARNFGFRVNALPFEMLAKSLPLRMLLRYRGNLFQTEALLFGQAGLLNEYFQDSYAQRLQAEYQFLAYKHKLTPMNAYLWKFLRLRPLNFPTLRIAQFARLMQKSDHLFARIVAAKNKEELRTIFRTGTSVFWHTHYHFGKEVAKGPRDLGDESIANIAINTVAPFVFLYARQMGDESAAEQAFSILTGLNPERNAILRNWKKLGLDIPDAARSQALIELKTKYCAARKCLECGIGRDLLKNL
ncbi:MAG TPA: DUF2851 family protein [Bacteroidia bacterium]|jgi:hypothetical protein|nr:DUF2851 family protein [Bacteroidia bacterium]